MRSKRQCRKETPSQRILCGYAIWVLPRKLKSLNQLKGWRARYGDTQAWEKLLHNVQTTDDDGSFIPPISHPTKRTLVVERLVPNKSCLLDRTNLAGAVKGLEDALVRMGYLVDDNPAWIDGPHVSQRVSTDKRYWTLVMLSNTQAIV